jgi:hypothetical protein
MAVADSGDDHQRLDQDEHDPGDGQDRDEQIVDLVGDRPFGVERVLGGVARATAQEQQGSGGGPPGLPSSHFAPSPSW